MTQDKTLGTLNHLIAICRDGEEFYAMAADKVADPGLQGLFREMAQVRRRIAEDLRPEVSRAGGSPSEGGTFAGTVRRVYANLKASLSSDKHEVLLSELVELEEQALAAFERAQSEPMTPEGKALVAEKVRTIRETHERMRRVKDATVGA